MMVILSMWDCVYAQFLVKLQRFPARNMLKRFQGVGFSAKTLRKFSDTLLLSWHIELCPKLERTLQWELRHAADDGMCSGNLQGSTRMDLEGTKGFSIFLWVQLRLKDVQCFLSG